MPVEDIPGFLNPGKCPNKFKADRQWMINPTNEYRGNNKIRHGQPGIVDRTVRDIRPGDNV